MAQQVLTPEQIDALDPVARRDLIRELSRTPEGRLVDPRGRRRLRWETLTVMGGGALALIPWMVYLGFTLPSTHTNEHFATMWLGFDTFLVILMASTFVLALLRRQMVAVTALATATMLICDAWFDVMTSAGSELVVSVLTAVFAELPLAAALIAGTVALIRHSAIRLWELQPGQSIWSLRIISTVLPEETSVDEDPAETRQ
ncbi:hypothetical protein MYK68_04045 [Gordonia sp. PP30]|uniref:hypothetical protein n=1 Tax=unclassified Gordonia (in: high G+C Gram-positive bacteria) TaxID=2657482 RepID=UPI001FFF8854|nr:hypothetical protein [Gordonia sp. PP30]UQE75791.1 hypothetical protein MYK68_04045 [Gordonia sp. PP30]